MQWSRIQLHIGLRNMPLLYIWAFSAFFRSTVQLEFFTAVHFLDVEL